MTSRTKRSVLKKIIRYKLEHDYEWAHKYIPEAIAWAPNTSKFLFHSHRKNYVRLWKTVYMYLVHSDLRELANLKEEAIERGFVRSKDVEDSEIDAISGMI